jgi:hypothetical protein
MKNYAAGKGLRLMATANPRLTRPITKTTSTGNMVGTTARSIQMVNIPGQAAMR